LREYVLDDRAALERLVPAWWALLKRAVSPQPTQTPLWLLTWWDVMADDGARSPRVAVVENDAGEVIGILPLLRRRIVRTAVIPVETLELVGSGEAQEDEIFSEYLGAVVARGEERAVAGRLAEMLKNGAFGRFDELLMPAMSEDDPFIAIFAEELRARGMETTLERGLEAAYIVLPATWDEYVAGLDGQSRYFVRRTLRDFEAWAKPLGGATLKRASTEAELAQGWENLVAGHAERWEGGGAFRSDKFRRFHEIATRALFAGSEGGTLDLLWLEVGGRPLASLYNIVYDGHVHFYQSGRTVDLPKGVRAGIAVHLYAIRRAIELGYKSYDFLGQPSQYKRSLAPEKRRALVTLTAVAPGLRARLSSRARTELKKVANQARRWRARAKNGADAAKPVTSQDAGAAVKPTKSQDGGAAAKPAKPAKPEKKDTAAPAKPAGDA
jgi:CelD/BcsL family acetyltransferase involved in cellulose biosynthesis